MRMNKDRGAVYWIIIAQNPIKLKSQIHEEQEELVYIKRITMFIRAAKTRGLIFCKSMLRSRF